MAAKEMYDYLSAKTADYTTTAMSVAPQEVLTERSRKGNIVTHRLDDGQRANVVLSNASIFNVTLRWNFLSESDAGTLIDFYNDTAKACGQARSFKWSHPTDGHTYVVYFNSDIERTIDAATVHGVFSVELEVIGYVSA